MLKEVVEQVMSLYSNAYYHVGTEINCLIIIMVLFGFMYYMKPRKTPYYYLSFHRHLLFCTDCVP